MKPFLLKHSISRKCIHKLSVKQRKRILSEIKNNLQSKTALQNYERQQFTVNNIQSTSSSLDTEFNSVNFENISNNTIASNIDNSLSNEDNSLSNDSDSSSLTINTSLTEPPFQEKLAYCFIKNNLNHVQCNSILSLLRTHPCFENLPKDARTILNTPRSKITIFKIEPGEYVHFDVESGISQFLSCLPTNISLPDHLKIDFNTDGCYLDKSAYLANTM